MPTTYPPLHIAADSAFEINTAGGNSRGQSALVDGRDGTPFNNTNSTAFASIATKEGGTVTMAQTPMVWTPATDTLPDRWAVDAPSTACKTGAGPWNLTVLVYGLGGAVGDPLGTMYRTILETN